ncbi:MAG: hypothetical protein IPM26_00940 [Saprospiraceae bacterium]|nr:hypothetical protein [Saprospiraceae bacterium]
MRSLCYISIILTVISNKAFAQYYDFPFVGWKQTYTFYSWTGVQLLTEISTVTFGRDTLIGAQKYVTNGFLHYRSENGKIYNYGYDFQVPGFVESLEYDFTLNEGQRFVNKQYKDTDSLKVIKKERILNLVGDSVWKLVLSYKLNRDEYDTIQWIEGVGDLRLGLFKTRFPDGGLLHGCTLLPDNRKISINFENTSYCNCQFEYGIDNDNDGFGNYIPRTA